MKKLILAVSFLCFAAAAVILILMPKPEKTLPSLPEADFNTEIRNIETHDGGMIKIIKYPALAPKSDFDFTGLNTYFRTLEHESFENGDFPFQDGETASYILSKCEAVLEAGDFLSYKTEGFFSNTTENYHSIILKSSNINVKTGEVIGFKEVISNISKFEKSFSSGKFTPMNEDNSIDSESSMELLGNYSPENGIYPDYYIDGEYFVVIAKAPAAMGGLTEYGISLIEAEKFLNKNSDYIKMIFTGK